VVVGIVTLDPSRSVFYIIDSWLKISKKLASGSERWHCARMIMITVDGDHRRFGRFYYPRFVPAA
jgi:hypothetical protein